MVSSMQRNNTLKSLLVAGLLACTGLAANAANVTFNFNASSTLSATEGTLELDIVAGRFSSGGGNDKTFASGDALVNFTAKGLGVDNTLAAFESTDTAAVNGANGTNQRDALNFIFSESVKLISVTFQKLNFDAPPSLNKGVVFVDGAGNVSDDTSAGGTGFSMPISVNITTVDFSALDYEGFALGIGARASSTFFISQIVVDQAEAPPPSVPVPAAGLLLGSVFVLPFLRRKRRAA